MSPLITISIVSHAQGALVSELLKDIALYCSDDAFEIILTLNLPEDIFLDQTAYPFDVKIIRNSCPLGFGANHNQAFKVAVGRFFCIMNPDIRLTENPFVSLVPCLSDADIGVIAPRIVNNLGEQEDNGRRFPSPFKILCKLLGGCRTSDYEEDEYLIYPDWVGGMFMLFPSKTFHALGGFDERYFLYYEDVDLCARLQQNGLASAICTKPIVIHQARRDSHKKLKYLRWHVSSMVRFFCSYPYLRIVLSRLLHSFKKNNQ